MFKRRSLSLIISICFFAPIILEAQDTIRFKLYYDHDDDREERHFSELERNLQPYTNIPSVITVSGYADYVGNAVDNFLLSKRRADYIYEDIQKIARLENAPWFIPSPLFFGESFSVNKTSSRGDAVFRSVEVSVIRKNPVKVEPVAVTPVPPKEEPVPVLPSFEELKQTGHIDLPGVNFIPGRNILIQGATLALDTLSAQLQRNPGVKIEIRGHVCCTDGEDDGLDQSTGKYNLSITRARAVYDYLKSKGVEASRMKSIGLARMEPKYPLERNPDEQQGNRRVEIRIMK